MKTTGYIFTSIFLIVLLSSCENREYNSPVGEGIGLEKNELLFSTSKDSTIVKTANGYWGVNNISEVVNDTVKVIHSDLTQKDTISFDWYTTYKIGNDIFVKVEENTTGKDRNILFNLVAGNAFEQLIIKQAGK